MVTTDHQRSHERRSQPKGKEKEKVVQVQLGQNHSCLMAVLLMMRTSVPFASPTSLASASSRALQENVAQEDIISVTRRDAIGRSRTTCAATQTERDAESVSQLQNSSIPLFVEIFAGRGSLSRAFAQAGFQF